MRVPQKIYRRATIHYWAWYDFLWNRRYCSSFYLRMVRTYSHSSIAHLEWFVWDEMNSEMRDESTRNLVTILFLPSNKGPAHTKMLLPVKHQV